MDFISKIIDHLTIANISWIAIIAGIAYSINMLSSATEKFVSSYVKVANMYPKKNNDAGPKSSESSDRKRRKGRLFLKSLIVFEILIIIYFAVNNPLDKFFVINISINFCFLVYLIIHLTIDFVFEYLRSLSDAVHFILNEIKSRKP